jgi:hypothetical protein
MSPCCSSIASGTSEYTPSLTKLTAAVFEAAKKSDLPFSILYIAVLDDGSSSGSAAAVNLAAAATWKCAAAVARKLPCG